MKTLTVFILYINKRVEGYVSRVIDASAETIFPVMAEEGYPDYQSARLTPRMLDYMKELPPKQHLLLNLMYLAVDFLPILFFFSPRRFRKLSLEKRTAFIQSMDDSRLFLKRMLADGLKANQRMIFLCDEEVLEFMGEYRLKNYANDGLIYKTRPTRYKNRGSMKVYEVSNRRSGLDRRPAVTRADEAPAGQTGRPARKKLKFA